MKEKLNLRLIAPKPEQQQQQTSPLLLDPLPSQPLQTLLRQPSPQKSPQQPQQYIPDEQPLAKKETTTPSSSPPEMSSCASSNSSCCSNGTSSPIKQNNTSISSSSIPSPTSCNTIRNSNTPDSKFSGCGCGSGSKNTNQQQKVESTCCGSSNSSKKTTEVNRVRLITCRCGDSCACPGCDAHPSRAMKGRNDPYTGFTTEDSRRRLSIASICLPSDITSSKRSEQPTAILNENGVKLCGCGCSQTLESCSNCFQELCQDYYSNVSTS
ncbi:hypothetical protein BDC45DRAFT_336661 [Circinella umbellata]|nr:hypothetical protein BDC45DRAFT_336661 [Circinella umbellata]